MVAALCRPFAQLICLKLTLNAKPTLIESKRGGNMSYFERDKYGMYKGSTGPGPALMGADTLLGEKVSNSQDVELGEIKEFMLDMQTGQVAYAVLAFGGFMGMGEKLFAVPWQALQLDTVNKRFLLNVDKERLKMAPGFDKHAWPNMADAQWTSAVHSFYGTDPARPRGPGIGTTSSASSAGSGASLDPRAGNLGDDTDISRIRGSNIG
jgi:sporulation protein YlmC with PRC-barrel domain